MINKYKVLILEDSFEQRLKIKKRLKDFNVLEADCINKATDLYKNNTFDLLLLDQNLPDGLGTEFFKEIVKTPKSYPPVILMTSFGNESFVIDCFHMGFNDYIVKSEEIFILLPEIANRVIRNHRIRTERDELLNKLKIALEKEQKASKAKSDFISMMSHDLKTPLNSIIGFSRRILNKDEALSDNSRKFLEIVLRNGQNLYDLIKSILDFGRLDVGNIKINKQKGSIKENLNYIFNSLLIQSQEKGLELNLSLDDNCDKIIEYDWLKFGQIISNLGQNAIKYSETGNIDISCSFVKEKQGFLVSVSDQGPGIKADDLKRMFEPFTQLDLKHYNKGTGLGLAIVKKLCDLLSIEISVESEISKGTQFNLYLGNPQ